MNTWLLSEIDKLDMADAAFRRQLNLCDPFGDKFTEFFVDFRTKTFDDEIERQENRRLNRRRTDSAAST